jgi:hypothetical protein
VRQMAPASRTAFSFICLSISRFDSVCGDNLPKTAWIVNFFLRKKRKYNVFTSTASIEAISSPPYRRINNGRGKLQLQTRVFFEWPDSTLKNRFNPVKAHI